MEKRKKLLSKVRWINRYKRLLNSIKAFNRWAERILVGFLEYIENFFRRCYFDVYKEVIDEFKVDTESIFSALGKFNYVQFGFWGGWVLEVENRDKYLELLPELMKVKEIWQGIIEIEIEERDGIVLKVLFR